MSAASKNTTAEIVALGEARAQRDAAVPRLDTAGAMLRAARQDAGYELSEVSDEINVKAARLEAIEAMDLDGLPAAPYALGFVRAYAGFLGLPVEPLVTRFREEAGWAKPVTAPKITAPKAPPRDREVGLVGILVVVGFVVWALWQIVGRTPPEEAALPSGFPIADRTEEVRVVPEVTTSLEDDLTVTPPVVVPDGDVAGAPDPATGGAEASALEAQRTEGITGAESGASALASPDLTVGRTDGDLVPATEAGARFALVPRVLTRPLGPAPAREASPPAAPPRARSEALNEAFLEEILAAGSSERPDRSQPPTEAPAPRSEEAPRRAAPRGPVRADPAEIAVPAARSARVPARLTTPVSPVYPRRCQRRAADEEVVTVAFNVSRFGRVTGPSVAATTNPCFDDAALAAVSRFGFAPATEAGRAVGEAGRTSRIVFRKP